MAGAGKRIALITITTAIVCVVIGLYIGLYLTNVPGSAAATTTATGEAQLYLGTVPAAETTDPHPSWVSYYVVDAKAQNWQHKTTFVLPANTLVHVTIYNYDSASALRNNWFGQPTGTVGGVISLNGKTTNAIDPDSASHVFSIPQIGLAVPIQGIAGNRAPIAARFCGSRTRRIEACWKSDLADALSALATRRSSSSSLGILSL